MSELEDDLQTKSDLEDKIATLRAQKLGLESMASQLAKTCAKLRAQNPTSPRLAVLSVAIEEMDAQQDALGDQIGTLEKQAWGLTDSHALWCTANRYSGSEC